MEKAMKREIDEVMLQPLVNGIVCADADGLCVCAYGNATRASAGFLSAVVRQAAALRSDSGPATTPVVVIETDVGQTMMKSHGGITTAIHKSAATPSGASRREATSVSTDLPR